MPKLSDPVAFSLGPFEVRWYALFILTGIILAILLVQFIARRRDRDPELVLDMAPWVVFTAILGARLYYALLEWERMARDPMEILNFRGGGLTIHGAIVGGALAVWAYTRFIRDSVWTWTDMIVPGVAFGQAIGRWGNWANQEAFGRPTDLPWAVTIDPARRPDGYEEFATFQPTFLYESLFNLAFAALLTWLVVRRPLAGRFRDGHVTAIYLIGYGIVRFFLERIRLDSLYIGPLPAAYWLSFLLIAVGIAILVARLRPDPSTIAAQ